jgi:phosphoribosylaminoimidazole carboxylase (NCAIR synthetase)
MELEVRCEEDCNMCSGEYCNIHFTDKCECDVIDRHKMKHEIEQLELIGKEFEKSAYEKLDPLSKDSFKLDPQSQVIRLAEVLNQTIDLLHFKLTTIYSSIAALETKVKNLQDRVK